ncbi:helix-turn-helix domain-containing protein [Saccharothrix deserti]|uniref:helix-turn-helix domain-containing protein n=1 Tax=Saccharothrix deserti TaxID=2593674 RepID=UPI00131BABBC|nr:helix-turn-helix domain-containing protein [Saccharothrix deserti]
MTAAQPGVNSAGQLPRLHTPQEIADALGCSEWWVKEQARRRRIPFVMVGGAYRFSSKHLDEIVATFEQRPEDRGQPATTTAAPRRRVVQRTTAPAPVAQLRSRPQRGNRAGGRAGGDDAA